MFGFVTTIGDLSITKADSPDPVQVNNNLTYTITVNNNGPQAAAGVQVTDPLPAGVNLVSATPDQGTCSGTSTVTCVISAPSPTPVMRRSRSWSRRPQWAVGR